jgi:DNA-binding MarR family transcriptional regulator
MRSDQELADQMADMPPDLRHLLLWDINSLGRWDVMRYFLENDYPTATLDDIAIATGRDTDDLLAATGGLVAAGWLSRRTIEGETNYTLTQERERRVRLNDLHSALHDHAFRLKALYHWIRPRES